VSWQGRDSHELRRHRIRSSKRPTADMRAAAGPSTRISSENVWSAARLQGKELRATSVVCANVSVNKGEGVVKDKDILFAARRTGTRARPSALHSFCFFCIPWFNMRCCSSFLTRVSRIADPHFMAVGRGCWPQARSSTDWSVARWARRQSTQQRHRGRQGTSTATLSRAKAALALANTPARTKTRQIGHDLGPIQEIMMKDAVALTST
jgi:hypothetical protein